jgi:hypothetical protein
LRQGANCFRNNRETFSLFTSTSSFDRGILGQKICLEGDIIIKFWNVTIEVANESSYFCGPSHQWKRWLVAGKTLIISLAGTI